MKYILITILTTISWAVGAQIQLYQLEYAPDSTYVIGADTSGEPMWVLKSTIANTDSIYISNDTIFLRDGSGFVKFKSGYGVDIVTAGDSLTISADTSEMVTQYDLSLKENPLTFNSPLSRSINTVSIPAATTSVSGYLTSTDWNTFNNKVGGSGTTNYIPKWSSSSALTTSQAYDNGTTYSIGASGSPNSAGRFESMKSYSNTSDVNVVASGNIPMIGWNKTSSYRFAMGSGYIGNDVLSILGASSTSSNPTTQIMDIYNTGQVNISESVDIGNNLRQGSSVSEFSFNHHSANPTAVQYYVNLAGAQRYRIQAANSLSYFDFFTPATGSNRNFSFVTSYYATGDFSLFRSSTAGGTPLTNIFTANDTGLGIMTGSPAYTLDVNGELRVVTRTGTPQYGAAFDSNGKLVTTGVAPTSGTVTSVGLTAGSGINISGTNPITSSGTMTISGTRLYPWDSGLWVSGDLYLRTNNTGTYPTITYSGGVIYYNLPSASSGQVLKYNGTGWAAGTDNTGTGVTSVTASSPLFSSGGTTPNITIQSASGSQNGSLTSSDWTAFNNKMDAFYVAASGTAGVGVVGPLDQLTITAGTGITATRSLRNITVSSTATGTVTTVTGTSPIIITSTPTTTPNVTIQNATTGQTGALTSTDWNTFNNKVGGSGTTNYIPKWSSSSALTTSQAYDDGTTYSIGASGSPNSAGRFESMKSYSNTSDVNVVASGNIPMIGWNKTSSYRFAMGSGYIGNDVLSILGASSTSSNPTTQIMDIYNTGQVNIINSLDVGTNLRTGSSSGEFSYNYHTTNPTDVQFYINLDSGKKFRLQSAAATAYLDFYTANSGSNRNFGFVTSYYAAGDFSLLRSTTAGGTPSANIFTANSTGLGVATGTPSNTLDVNGDVHITTLTATPSSIGAWSSGNVATKLTVGTGLSISSGNLINTGVLTEVDGSITNEGYLGIATAGGTKIRGFNSSGTGTGTGVGLTASNGIVVASGGDNSNGGDLTWQLTGQASAVHNLSSNGLIARTGSGTVSARTITAGNMMTVSNGDGVSANPTVTLNNTYASFINGSKTLSTSYALIDYTSAGVYQNVTANTASDLISIGSYGGHYEIAYSAYLTATASSRNVCCILTIAGSNWGPTSCQYVTTDQYAHIGGVVMDDLGNESVGVSCSYDNSSGSGTSISISNATLTVKKLN